jgi:NTP pyrophosphatase (non-canonical NTP hydrolase)
MALSLVLEAAELLELTQWKNGDELNQALKVRAESVGDELADVLYWVLLIAHDQAIDLAEAFERKLSKNEAKYPVDKARGSARKYSDL